MLERDVREGAARAHRLEAFVAELRAALEADRVQAGAVSRELEGGFVPHLRPKGVRRDPKGSEGIRRDQKGSEGIRRNQIVGEAVPTKGVPSYRQRPGARRHCPGRGLREAEQEAKVDPRLHPAERRAARRGERQRAQHGAFGRRGRALSRGACTQ